MDQPTPSKNFFDQLSPKSALAVGLVGGILVLCTIGFFVLLMLFFKNGMLGSAKVAAVDTQPAAQTAGTDPTQVAPPTPSTPVNVAVGHFPPQGKSDAPVTVVEFADLRCPFCKQFYGDAEQGILKDYVATGKVKYYFRSYAFLGPASTLASEAAECANEQGKFWPFHNWMYENQASESDTGFYTADKLISYADGVGVNRTQFANCLNSHKYASQVTQDFNDGQQAGVQGTPTIFINGTPLVGAQPYSAVKAAIDQALAAK